MRIDKFLWCIRFYKTRNLATEACKKGHISVNNSAVKPSKEVFVGDKIFIRKDQIIYKITAVAIPPSRVGAKSALLYYQDNTPEASYNHLKLLKTTQSYYHKKGEGRPTKKDRRDLELWLNNTNSLTQTD